MNFSENDRIIEHKTEHELSVINSFESALMEQHNLSHNELMQHSELLNVLPPQEQHQPVIVRQPIAKVPTMLLDNDGKC